jgi:hypothetical protein
VFSDDEAEDVLELDMEGEEVVSGLAIVEDPVLIASCVTQTANGIHLGAVHLERNTRVGTKGLVHHDYGLAAKGYVGLTHKYSFTVSRGIALRLLPQLLLRLA